MYYNFFKIKFCTKSALQRCKCYSTIQNLFTVRIKKGAIRNQEEGANLDGEDDNFCT